MCYFCGWSKRCVDIKTLITGAKGFIGNHFAEYSAKYEAILIDKENCWDFLDNFDAWNSLSLILHLGAISSTTERDYYKLFQYNVNFTIKLFEKAIEHKIPVKYASSASVYGNLYPSINPLNLYALSKATIDNWVLDNLDKFEFIQGFRYFNVYGQGEEHKGSQASPISNFYKIAKKRESISLFKGSEKFFRDFIYVKDLVDIVLNNEKPSGVYDLGTGNSVSFAEIAKIFSSKFKVKIIEIPFPRELKGKYQSQTKSSESWSSYEFINVIDYIKSL